MTSVHTTNPDQVDAHILSMRDCSVDWFPIGDVRTIRIIDTDYQRIDLLIIPVDTTPAIAELALTMVTDGQDRHITATVGHHAGPVRSPAEAEAALDNVDGASEHRAPEPASGDPPSDVVDRRRIVLLPRGSS
jgi:hypothetical protein